MEMNGQNQKKKEDKIDTAKDVQMPNWEAMT